MVDVDASFVTSLAPVVSVTAGTGRIVAANFSTDLVAVADLQIVRSRTASASFITSFGASVTLDDASTTTRIASAAFLTSLDASVNLTGASDTRGLTLCGIVGDVLSMWGILCIKSAPNFAIARAINDINHALQLVWNNAEGKDYWSQQPLAITLADGEDSEDLPDNVQNIVGPCRLADSKRMLTPLDTIGDLETFEATYLDGETVAEPIAYHIDRRNQTATDPAKCVFRVVPAVVGASLNFELDAIIEAPHYSADDLIDCPLLPIPHQYVESLLMPVARYQASTYYLFRNQANKATIDREYQQAMISLGLADPAPIKSEPVEKGAKA